MRETRVDKSSLIYPVFVREGTGIREEIPAMPGQFRYSPDTLPFRIEEAARAGVAGVMIFGIPDEKDEQGSGAWADTGIAQQAMRVVKREFPGLLCFGDVCLCEYTSHGHCGVLRGNAPDNDAHPPPPRENSGVSGGGGRRRRRPLRHDGRAGGRYPGGP